MAWKRLSWGAGNAWLAARLTACLDRLAWLQLEARLEAMLGGALSSLPPVTSVSTVRRHLCAGPSWGV